jgi:hypothetical protein
MMERLKQHNSGMTELSRPKISLRFLASPSRSHVTNEVNTLALFYGLLCPQEHLK